MAMSVKESFSRTILILVRWMALLAWVTPSAHAQPRTEASIAELLRDAKTIQAANLGDLPSLSTLSSPPGDVLPDIERLLSRQLDRLQDQIFNEPLLDVAESRTDIPLRTLLERASTNCTIRQTSPLTFIFGNLMPAEPSANSSVNVHFAVDCKRPAAYRIVVVDDRRQQIYGSFLPAKVLQGDGSATPAAVYVSLDDLPLGSLHRNNGLSPSQHEIAAELRASPEAVFTPRSAGRVVLGLDSAYLALIETGLLP